MAYDAAVDKSNASQYGLGASIWTADVEKGRRLATRLNVGMVWVNDVNVAFSEAPWGGGIKIVDTVSSCRPSRFTNTAR